MIMFFYVASAPNPQSSLLLRQKSAQKVKTCLNINLMTSIFNFHRN